MLELAVGPWLIPYKIEIAVCSNITLIHQVNRKICEFPLFSIDVKEMFSYSSCLSMSKVIPRHS